MVKNAPSGVSLTRAPQWAAISSKGAFWNFSTTCRRRSRSCSSTATLSTVTQRIGLVFRSSPGMSRGWSLRRWTGWSLGMKKGWRHETGRDLLCPHRLFLILPKAPPSKNQLNGPAAGLLKTQVAAPLLGLSNERSQIAIHFSIVRAVFKRTPSMEKTDR